MKRRNRIASLIFVLVFLFSYLSGCNLRLDSDLYNAAREIVQTEDLDSPTIGATMSPDPAATVPIVIYIDFSEEVFGFSESDIQITNADISPGSFTEINSSRYSVQLVNPAGDPTTITFSISTGAVVDTGGNPSSAYSRDIDYDSSVLIVDLASTESPGPTDVDPLPLTITFNQVVSGFSLTDFECTNCSVSNLVTSNNLVFTVDVDPTVESGTVQVVVPAGAAQSDITGRDNTEGEFSIEYVVFVDGITLTPSSSTIPVGDTLQLSVSVSPSNATDKGIIWSSSNTDFATVSATGLVTAVDLGSVVISVTADDGGFVDTCSVKTELWDEAIAGSAANAGGNITYTNHLDASVFRLRSSPGGTVPTGLDDAGEATVGPAWIGESEVTNAQVATVFQWAYDSGKMTGVGNSVDSNTVEYGGEELIHFDTVFVQLGFSGGTFVPDFGLDDYPCIGITLYGAIMYCNWLTEMVYGNTDEVVYTGIDSTWEIGETSESPTNNGFRLPSSDEWEAAARYLGFYMPFALTHGGRYWYPGDHASGANADYTNVSATGDYAWNADNGNIEPNAHVLQEPVTFEWFGNHPVGTAGNATGAGTPLSGNSNTLGIYDMSGNVSEWCFTDEYGSWVSRGGSYFSRNEYKALSPYFTSNAYSNSAGQGFRVAMSE